MASQPRWRRLYALGLAALCLMACTPEEEPIIGGSRPKSSPTPKATQQPGTSTGSNVDGSVSGEGTPLPIVVPTTAPTPTPTPVPKEQVLSAHPLNMASPRHLAFDASGNAWVACAGDGLAAGNLSQVMPSGTVMLEPPVGRGPESVAIDPSGAIWTTNRNDHSVTKFAPGSGATTISVGAGLSDLVADNVGNLWLTMEADRSLTKLRLSDGATQSVATTPAGGVALYGGKLWVSDTASSGVGVYATDGTLERTILTYGSMPGLVRERSGIIWVLNRGGNTVSRIDPSAGDEFQNIGLPGSPTDLAFDASGNVWISLPSAGKIAKISPTGAFLKSFTVGTSPYGLAFAPDGKLWITDRDDNTVLVFNP